jgi:hypothetical protein
MFGGGIEGENCDIFVSTIDEGTFSAPTEECAFYL